MEASALTALSPIDGRYAATVAPLRSFFCEAALIRERIRVEALWFQLLTRTGSPLLKAPLPERVRAAADALAQEPGADAPGRVKEIEQRINHDVKAVEYFVREELAAAGAEAALLELVHFGCTSEDINNLSYARLLRDARVAALLPEVRQLIAALRALAAEHAALPMLARTHGQSASPTTFGKEMGNVGARLQRAQRRFESVEVLGKWNGAVGNFNAHVSARPDIDWLSVSREFVESQQLAWNPYTTQIEPHDWIAEYCDACAALNVILIDLCRDLWGYISLGYLRQRASAAEVGSSTMPHKVNPIDFENAEGNFGLANAMLRFFADKLPISRWQRDLTDSTVLRNLGVALGHSFIGWRALQRGLQKLSPDPLRMSQDLEGAYEVLGEAIQSVLRAAGIADGYERLKSFSRGQRIDAAAMSAFVDSLPLTAAERQRLAALRPADYVGLAAQLARRFASDQEFR
ncbi:MAG TPA: adenylosuccinate lyase [Steroidobacteraceae bacterium]|jgi:adenylosuccinate lyase|nr:adenylosuccinate lyase [Steroidobacteraceae bacterium]